jgi:hypothetical protein
MSSFRFLLLSLLIALSVALAAAQSSPEKAPVAVPSTDSGQHNSSGSVDHLSPDLLSLNQKTEITSTPPLDRIRVTEFSPRLNQFGMPHITLGPDGLSQETSQGDTLCYAMRSYKVARDDQHSDSTHAVGYSTCQPAARYHVHTTQESMPVSPQ